MAPNCDPGGYGRIPKDGHSCNARRDLLEQFKPFPAQIIFEQEEAGGVAAGPRQALDEAGADRVYEDHEHDRHGAGHFQQRCHRRRARSGQDDMRRESGQFGRLLAKDIGVRRGPAGIDPHVTAVDPAQLLQRLSECSQTGVIFRVVRSAAHKQPDGPHPFGLLSNRGERPRDAGTA
jgi:hypothetical protein